MKCLGNTAKGKHRLDRGIAGLDLGDNSSISVLYIPLVPQIPKMIPSICNEAILMTPLPSVQNSSTAGVFSSHGLPQTTASPDVGEMVPEDCRERHSNHRFYPPELPGTPPSASMGYCLIATAAEFPGTLDNGSRLPSWGVAVGLSPFVYSAPPKAQ